MAAQALFLLNNTFVRSQSSYFANALFRAADTDADRLKRAYLYVLGRLPDKEEIDETQEYLREFTKHVQATGVASPTARLAAWQSYCQMMFCLNEFLYVE